MRYASVCDGIGAVHVAWLPLGWHCQWTSEIDPFPAAVVERRFGFRNLGDMTAITEEMLDAPVDLLVGGTPCQSFSVAGLRGGLADPRGNLALRFVQLASVMQPRWIVWENVPGVLSSDQGRDFGALLGALAELGYGFAYRILDAQWFGVAQRRRRVFVVGRLGDWRRAAAVLFERESVFGNPPTRREKREVAPTIPSRRTGGGGLGSDFDCDGGVICRDVAGSTGDGLARCIMTGEMRRQDWETCNLVAAKPTYFQQNSRHEVRYIDGDQQIVGALAAQAGMTQKNYVAFSVKDWGGDASQDFAPTMRAMNHNDSRANGGGQLAVAIGTDCHNGAITGDIVATITTTGGGVNKSGPTVMQQIPEVCGNLSANCLVGGSSGKPEEAASGHFQVAGMSVRRLTPRECERLQGFPDDYTLIEYRNKPAADSPRYRALGNSMAVPVISWLGRRIAIVDGL